MKIKLFLLIIFSVASSFPQFGMQQKVKIKTFISFDKVYPAGEFKLAVKAKIDSSWHINSNKPYDEFLIPTSLQILESTVAREDKSFELTKIEYPEPHDVKLKFSEKALSVWEDEILIGGLLKVSENLKPGKYNLVISLNYQSCNNLVCLPPTSIKDTLEINIADKQTPVNEINQKIFKNIDLNYSAVIIGAASDSSDPIKSTLENSGLLLGLIFVFIGGLALNLTPCVYPLIPITVGYFGGQSEGSTGKLFLLGLLFVIGMAFTYSVIGVITSLTGAIFGALLQNTYVIIFIAIIFIVLSLSMFGVYEFKLPDSWVAKAGGAKSGYYGAFFMGLTMGIVAAPCIGPFVIGLVTYVAAKGDPYFGFLMFFVLALGLGFPYLILAIFSGKIKKLPRAGEWMDAVKHVFGFILIGMAIYFILPLLPKSFSGYVLPSYMILTGIYLLFFDKLANKIKGFRIFKIVFSILLIAIAFYAFIPSKGNSIDWEPYSEFTVPAEFGEKKGMIIDFYADWCIPCKELDALTFSDDKVIAESKKFHTLKADMTKSLSHEVEALREKYNIIGVPTVLIIDSKGNEAKRITGFIDADQFYQIIKNVN